MGVPAPLRRVLKYLVSPPRASPFWGPKRNQKGPSRHPAPASPGVIRFAHPSGQPSAVTSLRSVSLLPVLLRGSAYKGRPWPFTPLAASMPLAPLRNTSTRPPDGTLRAPGTLAASCWIALRRMVWSEAIPITADNAARYSPYGCSSCSVGAVVSLRGEGPLLQEQKQRGARRSALLLLLRTSRETSAHSERPFRRPSGIGVSGVERHGCRESRDGPGMALRGGPLKLRWSEGSPAKRDPDDGARPLPTLGRLPKWVARGGETKSPRTRRSGAEHPTKSIADRVRSYESGAPCPRQAPCVTGSPPPAAPRSACPPPPATPASPSPPP